MMFSLVYDIGDREQTDREEFPNPDAAKAFARQSLRMKLVMAAAKSGSVAVGQVEGPGEGDIEWLGAYDLDGATADPVWSEED